MCVCRATGKRDASTVEILFFLWGWGENLCSKWRDKHSKDCACARALSPVYVDAKEKGGSRTGERLPGFGGFWGIILKRQLGLRVVIK